MSFVMRHKMSVLAQKLHKKTPVFLCDIFAIPAAWYAAHWLRYNMQPFPKILTSSHSIMALTLLTVIQVFCYFYFKTYRGLWRFFH